MSEEKMDIEAALSAFNRRDERAWLSHLDPDAVFLEQLTLNPTEYRGHEGASRWFRSWEKVWEDFSVSDIKILHEHEGGVVFRFTARGRGKGSGIDVTQDFWAVGKTKSKRFIRVEIHNTEARALEAAGIAE